MLAEREQKIQTEVKEIRKVFFCDLCNKQYKLAMEFEAHLSSYDHNHRKVHLNSTYIWYIIILHYISVWHSKSNQYTLLAYQRFKEMREMHGSSRDDRLKREQQRQEKEMAKFAQMLVLFCELY